MKTLKHLIRTEGCDKDTGRRTFMWWCGGPPRTGKHVLQDSMPAPASVETCPECVKAKADDDTNKA